MNEGTQGKPPPSCDSLILTERAPEGASSKRRYAQTFTVTRLEHPRGFTACKQADGRSIRLRPSAVNPTRHAQDYFGGLMSSSRPGMLPPAWTDGIWPFHLAIQRSVTASCCHL